MTDATKTFLITGVSSGLGRALAEAALADGHRVAGTVRSAQARAAFEALRPGRSIAFLLDVSDTHAVPRVVTEVEADVGPIDVLVNNAGYGFEGLVEEASLVDLRRQLDVNVIGAVAVIQAVLPYLRKRRRGHIVNVTSMGGLTAFPGLAFYHASKFALEGITETLRQEVAPFGIAVTAVEPGRFRTDWAGRSMLRAPPRIADYDETYDPIRTSRSQGSGSQPGDPDKAARAILTLVASPNPPGHLLLGGDALHLVRAKLDALAAEMRAWESLSLSTNFDEVARTG
jgi:NAD(P)-dependent dehydrogenase (short-subunit alcohol dehydrogenase family)